MARACKAEPVQSSPRAGHVLGLGGRGGHAMGRGGPCSQLTSWSPSTDPSTLPSYPPRCELTCHRSPPTVGSPRPTRTPGLGMLWVAPGLQSLGRSLSNSPGAMWAPPCVPAVAFLQQMWGYSQEEGHVQVHKQLVLPPSG